MTDPTHNPNAAPQGHEQAIRLVALREHALSSLCELSHDLTASLDLFELADTLLLNLMGQLGTSRAALWLDSSQAERAPVLVRQHGLGAQSARAIGAACAQPLIERFARAPAPLMDADLEDAVGAGAVRLVREAELVAFAPVPARGEVVGFAALGPRIGGAPYGTIEIGTLQAALGMVGVTIQNLNLYNRIAENNRQLRQANEHLQELDRLKSEFIQNVNHELRTPLTIILAYVDMLLNTEAALPKAMEFVKVVEEESLKLQGLIETLLTFSAVQGNRLAVEIFTGSVRERLERLHHERLPGVAAGLRELHFACDEDLPPVRFDERRLVEIVDALVDNAIKFTPEGARIQLQVTRRKDSTGDWVVVSVEDNGPGISKETLRTMFEPFRQADGSSTRLAGGMGIGLAVARQLAQSMGGDLQVKSAIGRGSTFSILLPVAVAGEVEPTAGGGEPGEKAA